MEYPKSFFLEWLPAHLNLAIPFFLALVMALWDIRTRRIPNYLTFGGALAGLGFQLATHGWSGMADGFLGLGLGLLLLLPFYWKAGLGAGDVKALAALGAWLGPLATLYLFIYMGISGGVLLVFYNLGKKSFWLSMKNVVLNWILLRPQGRLTWQLGQKTSSDHPSTVRGFPYGLALATGIAILIIREISVIIKG